MTEKNNGKDMDKVLFTNLITMLFSSAMQQLGKLVNPLTSKTEVNLEGAQLTIDMLSMLKKRTEGNLDKEEAQILNQVLSSLQMNFVEVSQSAPATEEKPEEQAEGDKEPEEGAKEEAKDGGKADAKSGGSSEQSKEPKYRKSYG